MPGHLGEDRATHEIGAAEPDVVVAPFGETPGAVPRSREPVVIHCHVVVRLRTVRRPGDLARLPSGRRHLAMCRIWGRQRSFLLNQTRPGGRPEGDKGAAGWIARISRARLG